jgi:multicomponent Na+:H+ antiporter subunit A
MRLAQGQTRLLQSGYLRYYLMIILLTSLGLVGFTLVTRTHLDPPTSWRKVEFYEAGLVILIVLATLAAVVARTRLSAIASLGMVGYGVALIFVLYGAPDVAMTQFLVETLTVILFVLVFYHLPARTNFSSPATRLRDAGVALAVGTMMCGLVLLANQAEFFPKISSEYMLRSYKEAHGRNVVNVILVDFRALDTLGEITVLAVAGTGVYALLKLRPRRGGAP